MRSCAGQLDLFAGDYRSRTEQRHDRGRIQKAYADCLTLDQAATRLALPVDLIRPHWPDRCPCVPDSSLDRRRVWEDVQALGVEGALAYHLPGCSDEEWLRATVVEVAAL